MGAEMECWKCGVREEPRRHQCRPADIVAWRHLQKEEKEREARLDEE